MDISALLDHIETALRQITNPRLYETERGFQGEFLCALRAVLPEGFLNDEMLIEQEYQKRLIEHGLRIRPDIIIHEPFDPARHAGRDDGNLAVIELKLSANASEAREDFANLAAMRKILSYPLAVFINIASTETHVTLAPEAVRGHLSCYAVRLNANEVEVTRATA